MKQEIAKGVTIAYENGEVKLEAAYPVANVVLPLLDSVRARIESHEIDPIKGTDLDKDAMLKAIDFVQMLILPAPTV